MTAPKALCAGSPSNRPDNPCPGAERSFACEVYRYQNSGF
jgi:hypothetical protein